MPHFPDASPVSDLPDLTTLDTEAPIVVHHADADGVVRHVATRVNGEHPARRLRALHEIVTLSDHLPVTHPLYVAGLDGSAVWVLALAGTGGRVRLGVSEHTLDDGFGRVLFTWPATGVQDPIERAARFLHAEVRGEVACRVCGCTDTWGCNDGCDWRAPHLCSSCPTPR